MGSDGDTCVVLLPYTLDELFTLIFKVLSNDTEPPERAHIILLCPVEEYLLDPSIAFCPRA